MRKYEEYNLLAVERLKVAELSMNEGLYRPCLENCHFSLELIMKSALYKRGSTPPSSSRKGHDLLEISKTKVNGVKFFHREIKSSRDIRQLWGKIHSRWDTSQRYHVVGIGHEEMAELYFAYRGVFKWIQNNYVK